MPVHRWTEPLDHWFCTPRLNVALITATTQIMDKSLKEFKRSKDFQANTVLYGLKHTPYSSLHLCSITLLLDKQLFLVEPDNNNPVQPSGNSA